MGVIGPCVPTLHQGRECGPGGLLGVGLARRMGYNDLGMLAIKRAAMAAQRADDASLPALVALSRALMLVTHGEYGPWRIGLRNMI
jgi:hypothetical protein